MSLPDTIETLAVRVAALEHERDKNSEAHGKIYERLERMERGHAVVNSNLDNIWKALQEIQADVKSITERPQKRWETIITELIKSGVLIALGAAAILK